MVVGKKLKWTGKANHIFLIILRLLRRISSGEEGKGTEILGKKIKIFKKLGWGRI